MSVRSRVVVAGLVLGCSLAGTGTANAQEGSDTQAPSLIVRDVAVFEGSAYEKSMNARSRIDSTLPRALAGRRTTAKDKNQALPLGVVTFEGQPQSDIDVLLEYNGRLMTHLPAASSRLRRLLWGRLDLTNEPKGASINLPAGHWLAMLDFSDRLFAQGPSTASVPYLLYDIEHAESPLVTMSVEEDVWSAKNTGRDPIHNVAIFRPADDGRYQFGVIDMVDGYSPSAKKTEDRDVIEERKNLKADPEAVKAVGQVVGQLMNAVTGQPASKPNVKATAKPSGVQAKPGELREWAFREPVDGIDAIAEYLGRFSDLGDVERQYLAAVLQARALKSESASLVYQLDTKTLDRVVPIEVTPQPDRLVRVGLVVVTDADPSLSQEVDRLIAKLGADAWAEREAAEQRLRELGRITERNLQAAQSNSDAEISYRAKRLLAQLKAKKL